MPKDLTILIVDKQMIYRNGALIAADSYIHHYEKNKEYSKVDIYHAKTPEKGLEILSRQNFDIIILDINFDLNDETNRDGINKFLIPLRNKDMKTPIISLSSNIPYGKTSKCLGANEYVLKNKYTIENLRKAINSIFSRSE